MLTREKPLVYQNPLSHLVTALPYIDPESAAHKSQIIHMINAEMQNIQTKSEDYIKDLKVPDTPLINSTTFQEEVNRIKAKGRRQQVKPSIPEIDPKSKQEDIVSANQRASIISSYNFLRNIDLQLSKKLGSALLKEQIAVLEKGKARVLEMIEEENRQINDINAHRKYQQLENYQKIQTIKDRIRILISKGESAVLHPPLTKQVKQ